MQEERLQEDSKEVFSDKVKEVMRPEEWNAVNVESPPDHSLSFSYAGLEVNGEQYSCKQNEIKLLRIYGGPWEQTH